MAAVISIFQSAGKLQAAPPWMIVGTYKHKLTLLSAAQFRQIDVRARGTNEAGL